MMIISSMLKLAMFMVTPLLLNNVEVDSGSASALFTKVQGRTVNSSSCMQKTVQAPKNINLRQFCGTSCMAIYECRFFCTDKEKRACTFWSSYVAVRWPGSDPEDPMYDACYTSWGNGKDVVQTNSTTNYSSVRDSEKYGPKFAIDGWACSICNPFSSEWGADNYLQIDLGHITKVEKVIAVPSIFSFFIKDVVVHLGDTTSFDSETVYGVFPLPAPAITSTAVTQSGPSGSGRYLTFYSPQSNIIEFCEVQVISA